MEKGSSGRGGAAIATKVMRRRRVLYVHNSADLYGASRSLLHLVGALDSRQFEAIVLLPHDGPLRERLKDAGIEVTIEPRICIIDRGRLSALGLVPFLARIPASVWRLSKLIKRLKIDCVHTNVGVIVDAPLATWFAGKPHVWHIRDWYQEFGVVWWVYEKYIRSLSTAVICVSTPVANQFSTKRRVCVIHNGFDIDEFEVDSPGLRNEFRERHGLGGTFVVGCVGRIKFHRKGQEVLVEALSRLNSKAGVKLLIVGGVHPDNVSHLESLKELVAKHELETSVILAGEIDDPRPAYAAMDLLVLPSVQPEPFGRVITEAMGMGLPVIATAIGGPLEQVEDEVTGFLVPPGDAGALADKIEFLRVHRKEATEMGQRGRRRLREKFDLRDTVVKIQSIYKAATGGEEGK